VSELHRSARQQKAISFMHDVKALRSLAMSTNWLWFFAAISLLNPYWFLASMPEGGFTVAFCCAYGLFVLGVTALYLKLRMRYFELVPDAPEMRLPWESCSRTFRRTLVAIIVLLAVLSFAVGMMAAGRTVGG